MRLSSDLGGALDIEALKRTIGSELPKLTGSDDYWVIARLGGWMLLAGEPAEPGGVVPRGLTAKPDAWESFPLNAGGRTVGLMGAKQPAGGFTDDQRRMLTAVATLMASAIKNIQLFTRVRELSMIDPLTRCLMRQLGVEALSREMRRMRRSQSAFMRRDSRPRLLQGAERHARPCRRRPRARDGRSRAEGRAARERHRLPVWRRRIFDCAA